MVGDNHQTRTHKHVLYLCSHTQETTEAITETVRDVVLVLDVVEEAIASVCHGMEQIGIVLGAVSKGKHTGLASDLGQHGTSKKEDNTFLMTTKLPNIKKETGTVLTSCICSCSTQ